MHQDDRTRSIHSEDRPAVVRAPRRGGAIEVSVSRLNKASLWPISIAGVFAPGKYVEETKDPAWCDLEQGSRVESATYLSRSVQITVRCQKEPRWKHPVSVREIVQDAERPVRGHAKNSAASVQPSPRGRPEKGPVRGLNQVVRVCAVAAGKFVQHGDAPSGRHSEDHSLARKAAIARGAVERSIAGLHEAHWAFCAAAPRKLVEYGNGSIGSHAEDRPALIWAAAAGCPVELAVRGLQ